MLGTQQGSSQRIACSGMQKDSLNPYEARQPNNSSFGTFLNPTSESSIRNDKYLFSQLESPWHLMGFLACNTPRN